MDAEGEQHARALHQQPRDDHAQQQIVDGLAAPRLIDAERGESHDHQHAREREHGAFDIIEPDEVARMKRRAKRSAQRRHAYVDESGNHAAHRTDLEWIDVRLAVQRTQSCLATFRSCVVCRC
jgi:hypothetical protein